MSRVDEVGVALERRLRRVEQRLGLVAELGELAPQLVGVLELAPPRCTSPSTSSCDRPLVGLTFTDLRLARAEVLRLDAHDAVRVDAERDLDLRHAARRRRDAGRARSARGSGCRRPSCRSPWRTWIGHEGLVVDARREDLALLGRDRRVARDERREDAAARLDAERQRRHVEEEDLDLVVAERRALERGPGGDDLVGVHALVRVLAEELLHRLLHGRHARHAADEDDVVDVGGRQLRVGERLLAGLERPLDEVAREELELRRASSSGRCGAARPSRSCAMNGRLISVSSDDDSSCFAFSAASFRRWSAILSLRRSTPCSFWKRVGEAVDDALVEVLAAEVRVAVGRLHAEDAVANLEDRDVERAAAEVVDGDALGVLLLEAVGERGRRRLVDDALDVEARRSAPRPSWPGAARRRSTRGR